MSVKQDRHCTHIATLRRVRATIYGSGKAGSITYCECVFVALGTQHEMCMGHIVICGLSDSITLFHVIS